MNLHSFEHGGVVEGEYIRELMMELEELEDEEITEVQDDLLEELRDADSCLDVRDILIAEDYFQEWCEEHANEEFDVDFDEWPFRNLDWAEAAEDWARDFNEVTIGGVNYLG